MRLPDFIVVGGQKCGTTSLHHILASHPQVYIPRDEIGFFDVDDIRQHPDFFVRTGGRWIDHDYERDHEMYLRWYAQFFEPARPDQLVGEDATTYIASPKAPARIAALLPEVKLVFMLRDPVARAYSHYWHLVRRRRASMSLERMIQLRPGNLLSRGFFREQVERYLATFPRERLAFVIFEEFARDTQAVVDRLCSFLGLPSSVDVSALTTNVNPGVPPRLLPLRLLYNDIASRARPSSATAHLPNMPDYRPPRDPGAPAAFPWPLEALRHARKLLRAKRYPPMAPDTREFLQRLYRRENAGLGELIGVPIEDYWPYMT